MTKEEAVNILARLAGGATQPSWISIKQAASVALNLINKPEPYGLDEAAEEYKDNIAFDNDFDKEQCIIDFKAGVKWDAEQGFIVECETSGNPCNPEEFYVRGANRIWQIFKENFKIGEKFIVQIRKK